MLALGKGELMRRRLTWAATLSIVMIPLLAVGWLDPLEGLPLLIIGVALGVTVRLLSRVTFPRFTWVSFVIVAGLMIATVTLAMLQWPMVMQAQETDVTVGNPLAEGFTIAGIPIVGLLLWLARLADLVMVAGLVVYTIKIFKARRASSS